MTDYDSFVIWEVDDGQSKTRLVARNNNTEPGIEYLRPSISLGSVSWHVQNVITMPLPEDMDDRDRIIEDVALALTRDNPAAGLTR